MCGAIRAYPLHFGQNLVERVPLSGGGFPENEKVLENQWFSRTYHGGDKRDLNRAVRPINTTDESRDLNRVFRNR